MSNVQDQLEGLPGYDIVMDYWNDYAEEHIKVGKNPYEDENGNKLRLPKNTTKEEQKIWKRVQSTAWVHDKCFLGSCGVGMDCGLGSVPLVVALFPVLGPLVMYGLHARLIHIVTNEYKLPNKLVLQMESQIAFDLLISLPPILGGFLAWLNGCSTRNAGMIYNYFAYVSSEREKNKQPTYVGTGDISEYLRSPEPAYTNTARQNNYQSSNNGGKSISAFKKKPPANNTNTIKVGNQQQSGFV
ncbi:DEHA2A07018p [Debaryomyces hansenii CBS767]|uniref:DEHA2A07018p n=1 Tax=Debaryomyces hansenii (strain ATCC 36239 / CBS 767 / BCRC 21394 / JCM 1990 / NBRC 0083 / IGC 2968) TaxID=284592 RepID=Q6BYT9_DEBHA|nr:DEHA2A07018p [Debaryomyces hansenii CBS767]CAG84586.2 DEHA2A07018p [Debaryomyces hansenii CBS767]|eukprot:XP_456630.2 DEHA2A07018p [Debaryomyces hansenii CBS767]